MNIGANTEAITVTIYKLLNQLFALVSFFVLKIFYTFKTFFTLIKILKLQHVSVLMDHHQGAR